MISSIFILVLVVSIADGYQLGSKMRSVMVHQGQSLAAFTPKGLPTKLWMSEGEGEEDILDATDMQQQKQEKTLVFGLDLTDPQDWVTVVLSGIVVYQAVDLLIYFTGKARGSY